MRREAHILKTVHGESLSDCAARERGHLSS
jgi:hypothetical protein